MLTKQLKAAELNDKSSTAPKSGPQSKINQREVAALTVEHEMLQHKVAELKRFLEEHPEPGSAPDPASASGGATA